MRILHCCLAAFYIDNYGYQENILPKMHKLQGHQVSILASTETYVGNTTLGYVEPGSYFTKEGIPVTRIPYSKFLPHAVMKKLRIYLGMIDVIESFDPDIIFLHDCQFVSIAKIASYIKKNPHVRVYVDGHTDFINSAKNWLSKNILHKIIYRWCAKTIEPYTQKFYGVLPVRVDFFRSMYKIPIEKIELLPLGLDDSVVDFDKKDDVRASIRSELNIKDSDFVLVTGGKIDERKNIHYLMQAIRELDNAQIKLIVFGTPNEQMKSQIHELSKHESIRNVGWVSPEKVNDYYFAADLAFFPGTHSTLWEQAVGLGIPCVFKKWEGIQHVDVGGNCIFINTGNVDEIKELLLKLYHDPILCAKMKHVAENVGMPKFLYSEIAKTAIEM